MLETRVKFKSVEDVEKFHKTACDMPCDVDALSGSYIVDAKSFMGVLTMTLCNPITIVIHSQDVLLLNKLQEWKA